MDNVIRNWQWTWKTFRGRCSLGLLKRKHLTTKNLESWCILFFSLHLSLQKHDLQGRTHLRETFPASSTQTSVSGVCKWTSNQHEVFWKKLGDWWRTKKCFGNYILLEETLNFMIYQQILQWICLCVCISVHMIAACCELHLSGAPVVVMSRNKQNTFSNAACKFQDVTQDQI